VTHENIVAIYAVEEEPIPYLVMEYVSGETLKQRVDGHGPLEVADVLRIGQQVASGLAAAHSVNLIHRDIKPSNILLVDGRPDDARLLDFGIARFRARSWTLTQPGKLIGTPAYMAPEQARGDPDIDHRADLFSLGAVLYECLTGRPAFPGEHVVAVLAKVLMESPRPISELVEDVPEVLEALVMRLLSKDADDRIPSARRALGLLSSLGGAGQASPGLVRHGITEREQVFHAVLLIRGDVDTRGPPLELSRIARSHQGRYVTLADGTRL
ncbi:MAG: serine/threonine protein kinase, partial [Myxococcales bacterium]|nr:serine/threonine protein kinase [Myxococcales bacterium]